MEARATKTELGACVNWPQVQPKIHSGVRWWQQLLQILTIVMSRAKTEEYSGALLAPSVLGGSVEASGYEIHNVVAVVLAGFTVPLTLLLLQASCDFVSHSALYSFNEFFYLNLSQVVFCLYTPTSPCHLPTSGNKNPD